MVLEVARIDVTQGAEDAFVAAYHEAVAELEGADGLRSLRMTRGVETPTSFVLLVEWDSVEAHEAWRATDAFPRWRELIGPHFAGTPHVEHYRDVPTDGPTGD